MHSRFIRQTVVTMGLLSMLLTPAKAAPLPVFPDAAGAPWRAQALAHGENATWITHAIAPDRKTFYVLTEMKPPSGPAYNVLRVLDADGNLLRWHTLREASAQSGMRLQFTDRGELVWDDSKHFHFIDTDKLTANIFPQCRKTDHPLLKAFNEQGKAHAQVWREGQLQALRARFALADTDRDPARSDARVPAVFWDEYQRIQNRVSSEAAEFSNKLYFDTMLPFAKATPPPLVGLQVSYSGGVVQRYVQLNAQGHLWYCDLGDAATGLDVRWSAFTPASGTSMGRIGAPDSATSNKRLPLLEDNGARVATVREIMPPGYTTWSVSIPDYDSEIEITGLGALPPQRLLFTERPPSSAQDGAFRLANGNFLLVHRRRLYLIKALP